MKRLIKFVLYGFLALFLLAVLGLGTFIYKAKYGLPFYDSDPPTLPAEMKPFSVLLFSKTNGFPHTEAIEAAKPAFAKMGEKNDWTLFVTDNAAVFNAEQLAKFDVVIWNNATGRNLTEAQRTAFQKYMESGGGFLGIHGAGDDSHHWDWYYDQLIGAHFSHHPLDLQIQAANLYLECDSTSNYPCMGLPTTTNLSDEWYVFFDNPRQNGFTVLYTLDETGLSMNGNIPILAKDKDFGMGEDHPIVWYKCLPNGGRTFYSAMGHMGSSFAEEVHLEILERAIKWAGNLEGKCE
ncbi:MAG: ThuA domain-containing protein [Bacteroidota bacterium]